MATVTGTKRLLDITGDNITTAVSLEAEGTLLDSNGTSGTSGQLLSSTGTGVDWVSNNSGSWDGIYSGSAQITGSLGVTGSIDIKGGTDPFQVYNNLNDVISFGGSQVNITKADDSIYASFGIGAGGQFTFQNPNLIVLGDDEGIDTGMILELDMTGPSMTLNGGRYFQSYDNGGDIWEVVDGDVGIRTKIESDGLGSDNSFWQIGGSNTNYSHVIGYEFGTNNDLKIGFDNCYNIDLFPTNLVNIQNGKLSVFRGTTFTSTIFLGGNSDGGGTGVNFNYSPSGIFQINDSDQGEGFFQKGANTLDIKIGDFNGVINEIYIEIDDTNSRVLIPNGNVGIGTENPSAKLHVQGTTSPQVRIGYDADNYVQVSVDGTGDTTIAPTGNGVIAADLTLSAGSAYVKLEALTGNVGIGTVTPSEKLEVNGNVKADTLIATDLTDGVVPYHRNDSLGLQETKMFSDNTNIYIGPSSPPNYYSRLTVEGSGISTTDIEISGSLIYQEPTAASEFNGEIATFGTFIETPAAGDLICFNNSLGTSGWREANNSSNVDATGMLGIAIGTTPANGILLRGFARSALYNTTNLGTTPAGKKLYIDSTNGLLTTVIPTSNYVRIVGYVVEADATDGTIYFCPDNTYIDI